LQQLKLDYAEAQLRIKMHKEEISHLHERLDTLNNEHQELRRQCQTLRHDTMQFSDRFTGIVEEKERLHQKMERLNAEKQDYLGRLRAISSVIDVIGAEQVFDESGAD
jgi:chromosome segregation ATPase